jgi:polar amino acid transport system substrate-binding protein
MNPTSTPRRARTLAAATATLAALTVLAAGCDAVSKPKDASSDQTGTASGQLPADVRSRGYLTVATDPTYPPFETLSDDQKTIVGLDPDLLAAIGKELGVEIRFERAGFDSLIPGLRAGRYDLAVSGMTDTVERQREVTFVDYFNAGGALVVPKGDPVTTDQLPGALCGRKVGVQTGTITVGFSEKASKDCQSAGKQPIDLQMFPSVPGSVLAMGSGRIDYVWTDSVAAATQVKNGKGRFTSIDDGTDPAPTGMAFPKESADLAKAVQAALQKLVDDGTYREILDRYGLGQGAITKAEVDGAGH